MKSPRNGGASAERRAFHTAAMFAVAVLFGACASTGGPDSPYGGGSNRITIEVDNLNWSDATLWAHKGGARQRLGVVGGKKRARFDMEWSYSQTLEVEIDLLAGSRCITPTLSVDPDDIIELQIPIELETGSSCLR